MGNLTADLAYWIQERYNIRERRLAGLPKPWSPDKIFQVVRFCNVHREHDKVTIWIRENWNRGTDSAWKFVLGRMINWPDSLAEIKEEWAGNGNTLGLAKQVLKKRRAFGDKVFTSAYTVSTCGKKMDKLDYVFDWVVQRVYDNETKVWPDYGSLEKCWSSLVKIDGLGSFLAAQVVADMKNTLEHQLEMTEDWWTWSAPGPGSLRGLNWYFYRNPYGAVTETNYQYNLSHCREDVDPLITHIPRISNQDFQNCLCEFSKYCKVKFLGGHVRNTYPGER